MTGNASPTRFSRRIKNKVRLLPIRASPKRKIRKSAVKKRTYDDNYLVKAKGKKGGVKNEFEEIPKPTSKILKRTSRNLKPVIRKSPQLSIPKIDFLTLSEDNLSNAKVSLENLELFDNSEVIEKKNHNKFVNEKKQPVRRSIRLSESSPSSKGKMKKLIDNDLKPNKTRPCSQEISLNLPAYGSLVATPVPDSEKKNRKKFVNKEKQPVRRSIRLSESSPSSEGKMNKLIDNDLKPNKTRPCQKKNAKQLCILSSESVLTPSPGECKHKPKPSGEKKSRLSTETQSQEISINMHASESLVATPVPGKVTRISRQSGNRKSENLSKEPNRSRKNNSEIFLNTSSFHSHLKTPQPEKYSEKRKSSRLLEKSPLRTLNKELSLSTPASLLARNPDSTVNKSSKSCKSVNSLSSDSRSRSKPKVSNKDCSFSNKKQKQQLNRRQKTSESFKQPLSNETENLPLDILTTPAPCGRSLSKKYFSKSDSKSSKRKLNTSASENQVANEELQDSKKRKSADFPKVPVKGTLKYKRWLLENLKEKNGGYEDDIFENQNLDLYKQAFHVGDESDGSSVNIATPKFDCILTPALPKKTPRFKDCISPTELLQARKTAEEYIFRRNKKRKSGDGPSSSGKNASMNKKNAVQDIPEKKKLDFEEAVNKLISVQKNLEIEAEVDDEEEDSYFSDA